MGDEKTPDARQTHGPPDGDDEQEVRNEIEQLEEDPPERLEDWPQGRAKYVTFGGPEGEHGYHEGPEEKLGPSGLRYHEDGSVTIDGEPVDDPEKYRSDPIPGGPTDPESPDSDVIPRPDTERAARQG